MARQRRTSRQGVTTVEFAVTIPILFLFVFTGIEFARINMIRNTIQNAAYEGARRGVLPGATATDCRTEAADLLDIVGLSGYTISVTAITPTAERVTVSVTLPITACQGYVTPQLYLGQSLSANISLPRERG